jgi:hypothetical protein
MTALVAVVVASCGGGGGGNGGGGTTLTATQQAAASSSAAQGAVSLSSNVAGAADLAKGFIPAGYAPGKSSPGADTAAIANIDPRLKDMVDKMLVQMKRPAIKTVLSKAGTFSKTLSAVTSNTTVSCNSGNYVVQDSMTSSGTSTTHTLTVTYNSCKDNALYDIISGSISATHTADTVAKSESATVTITNLTDTLYTTGSFTQISEIYALNGTFTSSSNNNSASGTSTALGTFMVTMVDVSGNVDMTFTFGNSGTPISDAWTMSSSGGNTTDIHTANGSYGLTISAGGQSIGLGITLAALQDKLFTNTNLDTDEWINGSITIGWTPDLSQYGCLNGTYSFTMSALTPIHTPFGSACPTSGTVRVNNAVVQLGVPAGYNVTVTLDSGPSQVFTDCMSLGGGMCGG